MTYWYFLRVVSRLRTKSVDIKIQWTSHRSRRSRSSYNKPAIEQDDLDKVLVNKPLTKTVEIKFQWTSNRPKPSRPSFSEPAIDQDDWFYWTSHRQRRSRSIFNWTSHRQRRSRSLKCEPVIEQVAWDQVSRDQVIVNQPSSNTVETKFQWTSHRKRRSRSSYIVPAIDQDGRYQVIVNQHSTKMFEIKF